MRIKGDQTGQALMLVLMIVGVGLVVTSALVTLGAGSVKITRSHTDDLKAYYIAEAGAEKAMAMLGLQPGWTGDGVSIPQPYGGGTFEIMAFVNPPFNSNWIKVVSFTSVGTYNNARKSLECSIKVQRMPNELILPGLSFENDATWQGTATINSDIFVKGNLVIKTSGSSDITGNIKAQGNVKIQNPASVAGHVHASGSVTTYTGEAGGYQRLGGQALDDFTLPPLKEQQYYSDIAGSGRTYTTGQNWNFSSPGPGTPSQPLSGVYFVNGNVTLQGTYTGKALIVATGEIEVPNARDLLAQSRSSDVITLISYSDITLGGNSTIDALILAKGDLSCSGTTTIYGAARAKLYDPNGTPKFYYNNDMYNNTVGGMHTTVSVNSWKEKYGIF